jgi:hypothetical protein
MKISLIIPGVALLLAAPAFAQTTGVSHPEELNDPIAATAAAPQQHYVKPSPNVYESAAPTTSTLQTRDTTPAPVVYQAYAPTAGSMPATTVSHALPTPVVTDDINSGVVIDVPTGPNELPTGTLLRTHLQEAISTKVSRAGSRFSATLITDVTRDGKVFLPSGSTIHGRITEVRGGHRIGGPASIRLEARSVTLPDGTAYPLEAEVVDLGHFKDSHVNSEGTIVDNSHPKQALAVFGLTTGSAAATGALIGGGVGAVVGAGIGVGAGTIWWLKRDHQESLPMNTEIIFSLDDSMHFGPALQ